MNLKSKKNLFTVMLSLLCAALLSCSVGLLSGTNNKIATAQAPTIGTDITIGEIATVSGSGVTFDSNNLTALYDAILGNGYTGNGTLHNVEKLLDLKGTAKRGSGVTTKGLNAKDFRTLGGKDIYVTFGNIQWEVVYVTTNKTGEIIVDLYQATSTQTSPFSGSSSFNTNGSAKGYTLWNNSTYTNISNLYGTSYIRAVTLGNGGTYYKYDSKDQASAGASASATVGGGTWGRFASGDLSGYLDAPSNVDYQEKENFLELRGQTGPNYYVAFNYPSDAYGTPTAENYYKGGSNNPDTDRPNFNSNYSDHASPSKNSSGATVSIPSNHKAGYEDWQNDKVWLPSLTETGNMPDDGIWGLSNDQRSNIGGTSTAQPAFDSVQNAYSWLRSGFHTRTHSAYCLTAVGNSNQVYTSVALAVRPAIHLNLTKAQADSDITKVPVPQNITVDYDASTQWLDTLETTTDSSSYKFKWMDADLHSDASIVTLKKIVYTDYYDAVGAQVAINTDVTSSGTANIANAGKYEVTLEIPSTVTDYEWRSGGTGTKTFTITIKQQDVPYTLLIKKGGVATTSLTYGDTYTNELVQTLVNPASILNPIYELWYAGTGTTVSSYPASLTAPTDVGTYSLTLKAKEDPANAGNNMPSNYKLTGSPASFRIDPKTLTIPTVTAPQAYTGGPLTFVLVDFNSGTYISMDGVTSANGNTATGAGGSALTSTTDTFEATKVDVYTATLSLRDTLNYAWADGTNTAKTVDFEVTQKELLSSAPVSSHVNGIGGAEWEYGDGTVTVTITDDRISGETISLLCYYDVVGGTSRTNTLTATTTGNVTVITMPSTIAVGTYTLTVELNGTTGDNPNYKTTVNNTLDFEITSGRIDPSTYGWIFTKDGAPGSTIANNDKLPFELKAGSTVDGVKYEVSIQIPAAHTSVVVDTSKYASGYQLQSSDSVGTIRTIVALKSTDPTFMFEDAAGVKTATAEVTLNWEIEKGTFDLSAVKWEYMLTGAASWTEYDPANPPQYNDGNYITVRVKASTLPLGLTLDSLYVGEDKFAVNSYTSTVSASDFAYNTSNFNAPDTSLITLNWEIAKKNLYTGFRNVRESYSNANGSGSFILKQLNVPAGFESYITYKYYDQSTGLEVTLADIKNAADPTTEKHYKVEAYIDPAYAANFEVSDGGSTPSDTFTTGSNNDLATVTIGGNDGSTPITADYDGNNHFDTSVISIVSDSGINITDFTVTYYTGRTPVAGNELPAGELPKDAGEYCIEITLGATASRRFILATDWFTVKVEPKGIDVPTLGEMVFNGKELVFEDFLGGTWTEYKGIIALDGKLSDRNVGAGNYVTTLKLTDPNYKWIYPSSTVTTTKAIAGYVFVAGGTSVTGDEVTATYNWNITPLVVDTTNMWNKGKKGATLNLPQNIKDLIAGGTLEVGYRYYDGDGNFMESPEIKGGRSFKVEAAFAGDDAERNVQFKTGDNEFGATSKSVDYTVPQSGIQAFFGNALSFLKNNWWWLLIALAVLIFLIILIVVLVKRRKNKEEREEKKRLKEEEKERREEEKRRREEEREAERERQRAELEAEKERQKAELELAKAKQEAELAKMKAEAAATAGMAATAVAAQPQQEVAPAPVQQQPQPQVQYIQQPAVDPNVLAEIKAELAEIRAENRANHNNNSMSMAQPVMQMPMPMQQPMMQMPMMQQPTYGPMPSYGGNGGGMDINTEMRARLAEERARTAEDRLFRTTEQRAILAEDRLARGGNNLPQQPVYMQAQPMQQPQPQPQVQPVYLPAQQPTTNGTNADTFGAVLASMFKSLTDNNVKPEKKPTQEVTQVIETESQPTAVNAPTVYPPDAVVTTTTTIDTTKNKAQPRAVRSDDGRLFDIDGFYDTFEGNK